MRKRLRAHQAIRNHPGGTVPVEDVGAHKDFEKDSEIGAPPTPAKSITTISASASLWSEKHRLPDLPPLPTLAGEFSHGRMVLC